MTVTSQCCCTKKYVLGSIHFLEGGWARGGQGRVINFLPAKKGRVSINFGTKMRWVTINFTASRRRVTFFNKNIKVGLGDFTFVLIGTLLGHPSLLRNECSLNASYFDIIHHCSGFLVFLLFAL